MDSVEEIRNLINKIKAEKYHPELEAMRYRHMIEQASVELIRLNAYDELCKCTASCHRMEAILIEQLHGKHPAKDSQQAETQNAQSAS